jgi:hypothetical protein
VNVENVKFPLITASENGILNWNARALDTVLSTSLLKFPVLKISEKKSVS